MQINKLNQAEAGKTERSREKKTGLPQAEQGFSLMHTTAGLDPMSVLHTRVRLFETNDVVS